VSPVPFCFSRFISAHVHADDDMSMFDVQYLVFFALVAVFSFPGVVCQLYIYRRGCAEQNHAAPVLYAHVRMYRSSQRDVLYDSMGWTIVPL